MSQSDGNTPLTSAILQRDYDKVRQLLYTGADPNQPRLISSIYPDTQSNPEDEEIYPLALALILKERGIFLSLLADQANPDFIMENGETPLTYAIKNKEDPFVAMLFLYGADPTIKNTQGEDAITLATQLNNPQLPNLLRLIRERGPLPPRHTLWQSYCNYLSGVFKLRELRQIAKLLNLPGYSRMLKPVICAKLEELLTQYLEESSYSQNDLPCRNKQTQFGRDIDTINEDYLIIDEDKYCFQLPVIEQSLKSNRKNPFLNKKTLKGQNLLTFYDQIPQEIKKKAQYEYNLEEVNQYL